MDDDRVIRSTRTVWLYVDGSELLYLIEEDRYICQRPKTDGSGFEEIAVPGSNDLEAMTELGEIAYAEHTRQMKGGRG